MTDRPQTLQVLPGREDLIVSAHASANYGNIQFHDGCTFLDSKSTSRLGPV